MYPYQNNTYNQINEEIAIEAVTIDIPLKKIELFSPSNTFL